MSTCTFGSKGQFRTRLQLPKSQFLPYLYRLPNSWQTKVDPESWTGKVPKKIRVRLLSSMVPTPFQKYASWLSFALFHGWACLTISSYVISTIASAVPSSMTVCSRFYEP